MSINTKVRSIKEARRNKGLNPAILEASDSCRTATELSLKTHSSKNSNETQMSSVKDELKQCLNAVIENPFVPEPFVLELKRSLRLVEFSL